MAVNMDMLLSLPQQQRKKIAEKLWDSLSPISKKEKEAIALAEKRWDEISSGKTKTATAAEFWKKIESHVRRSKK